MEILIRQGVGEASTALAAFDTALAAIGVHNYNLISLSSVIPRGAALDRGAEPLSQLDEEWGNKLYVVMAEHSQTEVGKDAWAGIGWVQGADGRGLFVEHHGTNEDDVNRDIRESLAHLQMSRPEISFGEIDMAVTGVSCTERPVSAVVLAVYESEGWGVANEKTSS